MYVACIVLSLIECFNKHALTIDYNNNMANEKRGKALDIPSDLITASNFTHVDNACGLS